MALLTTFTISGRAYGQETQAPPRRPYAPGTPQNGTQGTAERPGFATLRQDEDWSFLRDPARRTDPFDRFLYVPLDRSGDLFLTLGFDARLSYRFWKNESFGTFPGEDSTLNTRFNPHVGLSLGDRARLFVALKHGDQYERRWPPVAAEREPFDLHQAFFDLSFGDLIGGEARDAFVRAGRQELHYGSGRLLSIREGPNVRRDYDGALVRVRRGAVIADAFYVRPTVDRPDAFDNSSDETQQLWGVYSTIGLGQQPNLDVFYMGQQNDRPAYATVGGPVAETRHTVGARFWTGGPPDKGWFLGLETGVQFGTARPAGPESLPLSIRAAYAAGGVSYGASDLPFRPTTGAEFGVSSGDGDPADRRLGTFRAPSPPGRYFGESTPLGPGNLAGAKLYVDLRPTQTLTIRPHVLGFWRVSQDDGVYNAPQMNLRGAAGGERHVGNEVALSATWNLNPHVTLEGRLAHFEAGSYLRDNPPDRDVDFVEANLVLKF